MSFKEITYPKEKKEMYRILKSQVSGMVDTIPYETALFANVSALINYALADINWVGFYRMCDSRLVLGPFQGKPACVEIELGKGVCGTCAEKDATMFVENVHDFPGHIACDSASNSEIVIPIHGEDGMVVAVLDIDSPMMGRFDEEDKKGLEEIAAALEPARTL